MMVAGVVIVVIADLQQKTAAPKIELQTVKKGGEERKEVIRSSAEVAWMAWRPTTATTKRSSSKPRDSSGVSSKQNMLMLRGRIKGPTD